MTESQRLQDLLDREAFFGGFTTISTVSAQKREYRVGFKRLTETAILPVRAHATDSGFDLFADEDVRINAGETGVLVSTGIAVQLPPGYEAQVRPRSGVSSKTSLRVVLGTVDNSYTGEVKVIVDNISPIIWDTQLEYNFETHEIAGVGTDKDDYWGSIGIAKGSKIAQLVVAPYYTGESYEIEGDLTETDRGSNGFGSTGYGLISEL